MITILLEQIIELIKGWISAFTDHAQHVEDKLDSIDSTASDIKDNTDSLPDIEDNTAAVITPINNIKTNTDSIASSNTTIANNTTTISNQVSAMSTNVGRAAAYAEDCANNSLNILDKVTTIASDTTQIRTDTGNMSLEQSKIYDAVKWLLADKTIEETEEGQDSVTFNTDIADDLNDLTVEIVATQSGSGDPSPDNVRTINATNTMNLTVNGVVTAISLGSKMSEAVVDVITRAATQTKGFIEDLSSLNVAQYSTYTGVFTVSGIPNIQLITPTSLDRNKNIRSNIYKPSSVIQLNNNMEDKSILINNSVIYIKDTTYTGDPTGLKNYIAHMQLEYPLESNIISTITPQQITAIKGDNTIATDTNGKVTVTYTESIKHYLDKQDNA